MIGTRLNGTQLSMTRVEGSLFSAEYEHEKTEIFNIFICY